MSDQLRRRPENTNTIGDDSDASVDFDSESDDEAAPVQHSDARHQLSDRKTLSRATRNLAQRIKRRRRRDIQLRRVLERMSHNPAPKLDKVTEHLQARKRRMMKKKDKVRINSHASDSALIYEREKEYLLACAARETGVLRTLTNAADEVNDNLVEVEARRFAAYTTHYVNQGLMTIAEVVDAIDTKTKLDVMRDWQPKDVLLRQLMPFGLPYGAVSRYVLSFLYKHPQRPTITGWNPQFLDRARYNSHLPFTRQIHAAIRRMPDPTMISKLAPVYLAEAWNKDFRRTLEHFAEDPAGHILPFIASERYDRRKPCRDNSKSATNDFEWRLLIKM